MNIAKFFRSKVFRSLIAALCGLVVLLVVFKAGEVLGYRKAHFTQRWAENYHRNFGRPVNGFFRQLSGREYLNAHGVFGSVLKIDGAVLTVKSKDNVEKTIAVSAATIIRRGRDTITLADLKTDDHIVVIGSPNEQGQIEAKFIRVFP